MSIDAARRRNDTERMMIFLFVKKPSSEYGIERIAEIGLIRLLERDGNRAASRLAASPLTNPIVRWDHEICSPTREVLRNTSDTILLTAPIEAFAWSMPRPAPSAEPIVPFMKDSARKSM